MIQEAGRDTQSLDRMLEIWETAVRATHSFLGEDDIAAIKPEVLPALQGIKHLYCNVSADTIDGFIGVEDGKIEMLFIHAEARGKGAGKQLVRFAVEQLGATSVDVNEQNTQGIGFYEHMGFRVVGRSELDGQGRAFPLLHMQM